MEKSFGGRSKMSHRRSFVRSMRMPAASIAIRNNAADDVKSAAGEIYAKATKLLSLTQVGNDQMAFARNTLAPLLKPGMTVYAELKRDIFGQ